MKRPPVYNSNVYLGLHGTNGKLNSLARSNASLYGTKEDLYDRLKRHAYTGKKGKFMLVLIRQVCFKK